MLFGGDDAELGKYQWAPQREGEKGVPGNDCFT